MLAGYPLLTKAIVLKLVTSLLFVALAGMVLLAYIEEGHTFGCSASASTTLCTLNVTVMVVAGLLLLPNIVHGLNAYATLGLDLLIPTMRGKLRGER